MRETPMEEIPEPEEPTDIVLDLSNVAEEDVPQSDVLKRVLHEDDVPPVD